jgi:hypothetical protein
MWINHFRMVHFHEHNMLSHIMLFTNECCHVITLVVLLPHISLNFGLKNSAATREVSPSIILLPMSVLFRIAQWKDRFQSMQYMGI